MAAILFVDAPDETRQVVHAPQLQSLGKRIVEEKRPIAVVNELDKSAVHHLFAQDSIAPKRDLIRRKQAESFS